MRTKRLQVVLLLGLLFVSLTAFSAVPAARAQPTSPPTSVEVGVYLVNVQSVNLQAGTYDLDFYLWFNSTGNPHYVDYEFTNGQVSSLDVIQNTSTYQEYRVWGTFQTTFGFQQFPFDNHNLTIDIEDRTLTASQLVFTPDPSSAYDPTAAISGWQLSGGTMQVTTHAYPGQVFSRAVFSVTINRFQLQSFLEDILPIALVTLIGMMVFVLPVERTFERTFLSVTTLVSAVAISVSTMSQVPSVGYLTRADEISITVFILFAYSIGVSVWLTRMVVNGDKEHAERINLKAAILVPVVVVIFLGLQLVGFA
jgi:hypothetical protein